MEEEQPTQAHDQDFSSQSSLQSNQENENLTQLFVQGLKHQLSVFFNEIIFELQEQKEELKKKVQIQDLSSEVDRVRPQNASGNPQNEQNQYETLKEYQKRQKILEAKLENKPKPPSSSFIFFYQQNGRRIAEQQGQKIGSKVAKLASDQWKKLNETQKQRYFEKNHSAQQKYVNQMNQYRKKNEKQLNQIKTLRKKQLQMIKKINKKKQEEGVSSEINSGSASSQIKQAQSQSIKQQNKAKKEAPLISHRPKAPISSYLMFYKENSKSIAQQYKINGGGDCAKIITKIWNSLSKQQKEPYEKKSMLSRDRYHAEMEKYCIQYPEEVQLRKKRVGPNMRRIKRSKPRHEKARVEKKSESQIAKLEPEEELELSNDDCLSNSMEEEDSSSKDQNIEKIKQICIEKASNYAKKSKNTEQTQKIVPKNQKQSNQNVIIDKSQISHRPKNPPSSFFIFYHQNVKAISTRLNLNARSDLVKQASMIWNKMTDEEKKPYSDRSKLNQKKYYEQLQIFKRDYPKEYELCKKINQTRHKRGKNLILINKKDKA